VSCVCRTLLLDVHYVMLVRGNGLAKELWSKLAVDRAIFILKSNNLLPSVSSISVDAALDERLITQE